MLGFFEEKIFQKSRASAPLPEMLRITLQAGLEHARVCEEFASFVTLHNIV